MLSPHVLGEDNSEFLCMKLLFIYSTLYICIFYETFFYFSVNVLWYTFLSGAGSLIIIYVFGNASWTYQMNDWKWEKYPQKNLGNGNLVFTHRNGCMHLECWNAKLYLTFYNIDPILIKIHQIFSIVTEKYVPIESVIFFPRIILHILFIFMFSSFVVVGVFRAGL